MPTQQCLNNIASEQPPYNVSCTSDFCYKTSFARGEHCSSRGLPMDTPVLSWDPDLNGGQSCYCCCSCFTLGTPLEQRPGEFALIETLTAGDKILTCGRDLDWHPNAVEFRTGDVNQSVIPNLYYVEYVIEGETEHRSLLVTPDHPFLMFDTQKLQKVQTLMPGDKLTGANGTPAVVNLAIPGDHQTSIQSIEMEGDVDPTTLDGHLLNANGVVTADYAVQVMLEMEHDDFTHLIHQEDEAEMFSGSDEFMDRHGDVVRNFIEDPARWPKGFVPHHSTGLGVPRFAQSYLSDDQARGVYDNGEFNPLNSMSGKVDALYLIDQSKLLFPDITCILDWQERMPNAYSWTASGQKYILITGGLVRLKHLYIDGLSLIMGSMQASLQSEECVCEWDYAATTTILRRAWPDSTLATLIPQGVQQITTLLDLGGDQESDDRCNFPTNKCREESYMAGFSFFNLPKCAGVAPDNLNVLAAYASIDNAQITIRFNLELNVDTATAVHNYHIIPEAQINAAVVDPSRPKEVVLDVEGLSSESNVILIMKNLLSTDNTPLGPDQDKQIVRTN